MQFSACVPTVLICAALVVCPALAAPYKPSSDAQVLERLPFKPSDPVVRELAQMRGELQRDPRNRPVAVRLALRYYGMVAEEGDPRYLGYAQAALAPWWDLPTPPTDVQLVRARLRQFLHDFPGALVDLGQVIQREPQHAQARLLRAIINIVQARYDEARADCQAMRSGAELLSLGCEATIDGLTGKAAPADARLQAALDARPTASNDEKLWLLERLAELAQLRGLPALAEQRLAAALKLGNSDTFLLAAYTDLLLEQNRPAEVVALLKDKVRSDGLLLRLVFAEHDVKAPAAAEHEAALAARYAAAQLRGDTVHQQEEARFELRTRRDPKKALFLAQENWKVQREPRDAKIFLEAALASKNPEAAKPVLEWLATSGIEDPGLRRLGAQLRGGVQ